MNNNLYEAPKSIVDEIGTKGVDGFAFTDAGILYLKKGFQSPRICILSGEIVGPSSKPRQITISYIPPLIYLSLLLGVLIGLIIIACVQKTVKVNFYLSEKHTKTFKKNKLISWFSFALSLLLLIAAIKFKLAILGFASAAVFLFCLIWIATTNKILKLIRYKNKFFELASAHPNYLTHIPVLPTATTAINSRRN